MPLNLQIEITRDEFVTQVADIVDRTFPVCDGGAELRRALASTRSTTSILVGGTTKIPYVRDQVSKFFAKAPRTDVNPEDAVAIGAALQATSLERILGRRTSSVVQVPGQALNEATTVTQGVADVLELIGQPSATMAPSDALTTGAPRTKRGTAGYPVRESTRPDTSYSEVRAGAKEVFEERTPPPSRPAAQSIGRIKATPPPSPRTTTFGVAAAPPPTPPPPSSTARGVAAQRPPLEAPVARPSPTRASPQHGGGFSDDFQTGPALQMEATTVTDPGTPLPSPSVTRPMAPAVPIAPPTSPTMMATSPPGAAAGLELSPASTAKGFQPPQAYPVMQPPAARPAPVVIDVTPRSLGIATVAGYCEELIRRNSRVPAEMRKLFTTSRDQQDVVRIVVCQGESRRLDNNTVIGDLVLQGLPPRPRGETSIEVTFALDASGILQVTARDAKTGKEQSARLDLVGGMPSDVAASRERIQQLRR